MEPEGPLPWYKNPPLVPIMTQMNPVHTTPSYFCKIHFNIIQLCLGLPSGFISSGFPSKILYTSKYPSQFKVLCYISEQSDF
jgi:hypothetical protein